MSSNIVRGFSYLLAMFTIALGLGAPARAQWGGYTLDTLSISPASDLTNAYSLAIDTAGFAHVAWQLQAGGGSWILYSTNAPAGDWQAPDTVNEGNSAFSPAIDINPLTGAPIVAYSENGTLLLATPLTEGWTAEPIATDPVFLSSAALVVDDSAGIPHLAWIGSHPDSVDVYKIFYRAVFWSSEIQMLEGSSLGPFGLGAAPDITVEHDGRVHITYRGGDFGMYHIDHAWNNQFNGQVWNYETVTSPNGNDYISSIEMDGYGTLHLAVSGNDGFGFPSHVYYLARPAGSGWLEAHEATAGFSATNPSLAVDAAGAPHIVSMGVSGNFYTGVIFYSYTNPVGWETDTLIAADYLYPSLAIDQAGFGHVALSSGADTGIENVYHLQSEDPVGAVVGITVTPDSLDFGTVLVNSAVTLELAVQNNGTAPAIITGAESTDPAFFSTFTGPDTLAPGAQMQLPVTFAPLDPVEYNGILQITVAGVSRTFDVPLHGVGQSLSAGDPPAPLTFELGAYPNPFNPETSLSFALPQSGHVRLSVYNILGHLETTLADEWMAAGRYSIPFSGAHLPSGLYIAQLQSGGNVRTMKLMLLK